MRSICRRWWILLLISLIGTTSGFGKRRPNKPSGTPLNPKKTSPEKVAPGQLIDPAPLRVTLVTSRSSFRKKEPVDVLLSIVNSSKTQTVALIFHHSKYPIHFSISGPNGRLVYRTLTGRNPTVPAYFVQNIKPGETIARTFRWKQNVRYRDDDGRLIRGGRIPAGSYTITARLTLDGTYYLKGSQWKGIISPRATILIK